MHSWLLPHTHSHLHARTRTHAQEAAHSQHGKAAAAAEVMGVVAAPVRMDGQGKYGVLARGEAHIYMRLPRPGCCIRMMTTLG